MTTGELIALLRNKNRISQSALANDLHIGQSTLAMYEKGKRNPNLEMLAKLADYFNVTTDYLLGRPDKEDNSKNDTADLAEILNNAKAYNGKELNQHDRDVLSGIISAYLDNKA